MESKLAPEEIPLKQTTSPIVTGSSVLAIKYKDGIMMMADTLGSYGTLARFTELDRIRKVNDLCIVGATGEWSDFQFITKILQELTIEDFEENDGHLHGASQITSYLSRVLYNRRTRINPLWNQVLIAGFDQASSNSVLGTVDLYGSCFYDDILATGFGMYLATPLLRRNWHKDLSQAEAQLLLERCMTVLFYRDCRSLNRYTIATVTPKGITVSPPYSLATTWTLKLFVEPSDKISPLAMATPSSSSTSTSIQLTLK